MCTVIFVLQKSYKITIKGYVIVNVNPTRI